MTAPVAVEELAALLAADVPCGSCGSAAQLRSMGHRGGDCGIPSPGPFFQCVACYQKWAADVLHIISEYGAVLCRGCMAGFTDVDDFSMFRTF